jgi:general secretion pathway protein D
MSVRRLRVFVLCCALFGCASSSPFDDGRRLIEEGKSEEGLARVEQAIKEDPYNREYRTFLIRNRELLVARYLARADGLRDKDMLDEADKAYADVLRVDPDNERAKVGIAGTASDRRLKQQVSAAEAMFAKGDFTGADATVRAVLIEKPAQRAALDLRQRLREKRAATQALASKPIPSKSISLEFRDATIRSVFELIAKTSGMNFVFDRDVRPDLRVTIFVRDTTIDDVIKVLLATNQLERKMLNGNSMLIYPNTPAKLREYQDLVVRGFYLGNADAKQMLNTIRTLVKTRDILYDDRLNMVLMRDTPEAVRLAEKVVATQDLAEPEVMLEVEVIEVKRSRLTEIGIQYPDTFTVLNIVPNPDTVVTSGGVVTTVQNATTTTTQLTLDQLKNLKPSQIGIPNPQLNLHDEDSDVDLLANPRIRVKNREKAKIHIGDKVPVITSTAAANVGVTQSVNYLDVGLQLDVEPTVTLDNEVSIKVGLEVSSIVREISNQTGTLAYQLGTRNATTVLRLKNGETQVLAGLINDEDRKSANKFPGLGDLPVVGRLFSSHKDDKAKTEIMLLITPRVLRNIVRPDSSVAEFFGGTEAAAGAPPLSIAQTAPSTLAVSFASGGAAGASSAGAPAPQAAAAPAGPLALMLNGPSDAKPGQEFPVSIALPGGVRHLELDLIYDPAALTASTRPNLGAPDPGRVHLSFENTGGGTETEARFRVVAKTAGNSQLSIENVTAVDDANNPLTVAPAAPIAVKISP